MFEYVLAPNAKQDLQRIYLYGLGEYGELKANEYFRQFFKQFDKIAENPFLYQSVDHLRPDYRRCPCGTDTIYYRINNSTVEIMAILGGQDIEAWL